jgi:hypothetical protein
MNANYDWTRSKRRTGKLNVQDVDWVTPQFGTKRKWYADKGRVRKRGANREVRPPVAEPCYGLIPGDINGVIIDRIDLGERFDQIRGITLIATKTGANRVGVDCNTQVPSC